MSIFTLMLLLTSDRHQLPKSYVSRPWFWPWQTHTHRQTNQLLITTLAHAYNEVRTFTCNQPLF